MNAPEILAQYEATAKLTSERLAGVLFQPTDPMQHWAALGIYANLLNKKIFTLEEFD